MADDDQDKPETSDLVTRVHRYYKESRDHSSEWRQEARTSYDMVAGEQWDSSDLEKLKSQERPAVVFNRIARTINAVIGTQVANRQETRFIPREQGDVQVNEILSAAGDWARDNCDAEDEESDAFEDMCITGMGWTETRMDYETDPDGAVVVDRIDPLEMYWDPGAGKRNLSDGKWVMRVRLFDREEFESRWPDADIETSSSPWESVEDDVTQRDHVYPQDAYKYSQATKGAANKGKVRVAQLQYCDYENEYRVGKRAERLSEDKFKKIEPKLKEKGAKYLRQRKPVWRQAFVAGGTLLEEGDCPFPDGATLRCMTYKRDRNKNTWFGIVRPMMDPQRFGNKFFSQILDILNKGAKGGVMAEKDAVDDARQLEEKWARPDSVIWFSPGALVQGKVQPKPLVNWPAGLDKLMTFSMDSVHEVTGINLELLGFANREQAGVLEHQRKQAGLTIIAPLFDAMRRYRKEQGRVLLHFIQEYISDGRLIRITGGQAGHEQYIPLVRQPETVKYDVIVDEAPTSPNMKERVYGALVQMLPALGKMGIPMPPELLDYAPIPSALAQKWKETIQKGQQLPPEAKQRMEKLMQENQQLKSKREETMLKLQADQQQAQADIELERVKAANEIQLAREKAQAELQLEREKAAADIELERQKLGLQAAVKEQELSTNQRLKESEHEHNMRMKEAELVGNMDGKEGMAKEIVAGTQAELAKLLRTKRSGRVTRTPEGFIDAFEIIDEPHA